jgi:hypothetical protein
MSQLYRSSLPVAGIVLLFFFILLKINLLHVLVMLGNPHSTFKEFRAEVRSVPEMVTT